MPPPESRAVAAATQNPRQRIEEALARAVRETLPDAAASLALVERPRDAAHGDYATTAALALAKAAKRNPRELAKSLADSLQSALPDVVASSEIAGPGFINLRLTPAARQQVVHAVLRAGAGYGRADSRAG